MKGFGNVLKIALLLAAVGAAYYFFFPAPEKVIRKRLEKLASTVSERPSGNIAIIGNVNSIADFFHPEVTINLQGFGRGVEGISSRQEIRQMALGARQQVGGIEVKFYDVEILVDDTRTNATVVANVLVNINQQPDAIVQRLRIQMEKLDRTWLVRSAAPVESNGSDRSLRIEGAEGP